MNRRQFIKTITTGAMASLLELNSFVARRTMAANYFGLHPFIEGHPEAVFIRKTNVSSKMDSEAKLKEGVELAKEIFTLKESPGIKLSQPIAIKPNLTCANGRSNTEEGIGIITDPYFVKGMLDGMMDFGVPADNIYIREGNWLGDSYCPREYLTSPYVELLGDIIHITDFPTGRKASQLRLNDLQEGTEVIWKDCPNGMVFRRIGYVAPFNHKDSWTLNIAKFKCHTMGMTLSAKNLQGMCVHPYIHFCEGVGGIQSHPANVLRDFQPDFDRNVKESHSRHLTEGVPRWDKPGISVDSGYGMELWAQRTCDSISVSNVGLSMIEGIYGRDGNAFFEGPGPGGKAQDFMTNIVLFGKNPFLVDIIGHWLGGHEPGNFGLFHIAKERALCETINPMRIPIYLWENGIPELMPLEMFERYDLKTRYLQKNYNKQNEPLYHLVNEHYDYSSETSVRTFDNKKERELQKPNVEVIGQNFPNPFNGKTNIEYVVPNDGYVILEIYNSVGEKVDVLVSGQQNKGIHVVSWDPKNRTSGVYFYIFRMDGFQKIGKMVLAR